MLEKNRLWKLWLVGQSKGQSSLGPNSVHYINASWPFGEREKFRAHKEELKRRAKDQAGPSRNSSSGSDSSDYADVERDCIQKHY